MICCMFCLFFLLIILRPPRSTLTDTLLPYTTLFRSLGIQTVVIPGRPGFDQRPHHTHARLEGEFMRASRLFARNVCLSKAAGIVAVMIACIPAAAALEPPITREPPLIAGEVTLQPLARKSVVEGKRVSERVDLGGC